MEKELISIIMPVFNRETLIIESLKSIIEQQYENWECIIVDDHSTDKTWTVVQNFIKKDTRFRLYKRPISRNKGANACRNYGRGKARGEYIHWFDSDDIAHPDCLKRSCAVLEIHKVDFCRFSREIFFGEFNRDLFLKREVNDAVRFVDSKDLDRILKNELEFNTCNVLWRKTALGAEKFNEDIVYADEWEYYSRLLAKGLSGVSIEDTLFYGRKHADSTTFEYLQADSIRRDSKIKATEMVIKNLGENNLINESLADYFLKLGLFLKSKSVIYLTLDNSETSIFKRIKYKFGFFAYPVLRPLFKLKGKIKTLV